MKRLMQDLPAPRVRQVAIADLTPYPEYGRDRSERRLTELRRSWVPAAIGAVHVSKRANGALVVIEGNHRLTVAKEKGEPVSVACLIHENLSFEEEATLYRILNDMLPPKPLDLFKAEMAAGNADAIALNTQVEEAGFTLGATPGPRNRLVSCIRALQGVQRLYGTARVGYTLRILHSAFGGNPAGVRDHTVAAVAVMLEERKLDAGRLGEIAGGIGYMKLKGMANSVRQEFRIGSQADALVRVLTQEYNRGLPRHEKIEQRRIRVSARMLRRQGQTREAIWNERVDEAAGRPD